MKMKNLLFGMLACTALVGCSNDDDPVVNNGNQNELANSYMAIRIADANKASSRAGGYDEGKAEERKINDADFFFYEASGRFVALVEKSLSDQTTSTGNVSDKKTVLVLEKTQLQPATLITLVNSPIEAASLRGLNLNEMKAKIEEISKMNNYASDNSFFMTSSSYFDGTNVVYGTSVEGKLKESQTEAENAPVDVYVERLAAKATVAFTESEKEIPSQIVDETPQTIMVRLKGWGLNGTNKNAYLIKSLQGVDFGAYTWANAAGDFRSFWAVDDNYATGKGKYATIYKDLLDEPTEDAPYSDATIDETDFSLDYISANEATLTNQASYCLENTSNVLLEVNKANPYTSVTIIAEVILQDNEAAETIYKYNGAFYTESSMKNLALNLLADYKKVTVDASADLTSDDIVVADAWDDSNNKVKFEVNGEGAYTLDGESVDISALNERLATLGTAFCFTNGLCYYNVPIKHIGEESEVENNGVYGMVRNHTYALNVTKISNVGEAVYKPDAPIIPTITPTPEDFYLSTTLNVLSWKTVSQDVEL